MSEDIEQFLADEAFAAYRDSLLERIARWIRKHQSGAAVPVGAALLVILMGSLYFAGRERGQRQEIAGLAQSVEVNNRELAGQLGSSQVENKSLRDDNGALRTASDELSEKLGQSDSRVHDAQTDLASARAARELTRKQLDDLRRASLELEAKRLSTQIENEQLVEKNAQLTGSNNQLAGVNRAVQRENDALKQDIARMYPVHVQIIKASAFVDVQSFDRAERELVAAHKLAAAGLKGLPEAARNQLLKDACAAFVNLYKNWDKPEDELRWRHELDRLNKAIGDMQPE
jgi:hypothetical protein